MKIGFLGGSFDPVHCGHLRVARAACGRLGLDRVVFVPAARAPLKAGAPGASPAQRLAMLRAALKADPRFRLSAYELRRGGTSYTIDSARHFRARHPRDELYWIIGGDQLARLRRWKDVAELARLVRFAVVARPGHPAPARPAIPGLRLRRCGASGSALSSTELRRRLRRGLPLDGLVPDGTAVYIRRRGLYRGGR